MGKIEVSLSESLHWLQTRDVVKHYTHTHAARAAPKDSIKHLFPIFHVIKSTWQEYNCPPKMWSPYPCSNTLMFLRWGVMTAIIKTNRRPTNPLLQGTFSFNYFCFMRHILVTCHWRNKCSDKVRSNDKLKTMTTSRTGDVVGIMRYRQYQMVMWFCCLK